MLLAILLFLLVTAGGGAAWLLLRRPAQLPAPDIKVPMTPERIARGRYIFLNLADCGGCHSDRDFSRVGGPEVQSGRGRGSVLSRSSPRLARHRGGAEHHARSRNRHRPLDGRREDPRHPRRRGPRRTGAVSHDALYRIPPHERLRRPVGGGVSRFAAAAAQPAAADEARFSRSTSSSSSLRAPVGTVPDPNPADTVRYGEYLANVGGCGECHTPLEKGRPVAGMEFAGGQPFATNSGNGGDGQYHPRRRYRHRQMERGILPEEIRGLSRVRRAGTAAVPGSAGLYPHAMAGNEPPGRRGFEGDLRLFCAPSSRCAITSRCILPRRLPTDRTNPERRTGAVGSPRRPAAARSALAACPRAGKRRTASGRRWRRRAPAQRATAATSTAAAKTARHRRSCYAARSACHPPE